MAAGGTAGHVVPAMAVADALVEAGRRGQLPRHPRADRGRAGPGRRLRDRLHRGPRHRPPQPAARPRCGARAGGRRRSRSPARCCAGAAPTRSWAAAATSPAPAGLAAAAMRTAAGPDRGRQPPRPRQPPAGAAGAAGLPRLPDRGPRRGPLPGHRPAGPGRVAGGPRPRRGSGSGSLPTARCLLVFGGSQGARSINLAAARCVRAGGPAAERPSTSSTSPGAATIRRLQPDARARRRPATR